MNFAITGLPRSRTAWFAAYFTACGHTCAHEGMNGCGSISEYESNMDGLEGNSDSGILLYPFNGKTVIIERDVELVKSSLLRFFPEAKLSTIDNLALRLDKIEGLRVKFDDIDDRLQEIHEYCVDSPYDETVAELFKNMVINLKNLTVCDSTIKLYGELLCQQ